MVGEADTNVGETFGSVADAPWPFRVAVGLFDDGTTGAVPTVRDLAAASVPGMVGAGAAPGRSRAESRGGSATESPWLAAAGTVPGTAGNAFAAAGGGRISAGAPAGDSGARGEKAREPLSSAGARGGGAGAAADDRRVPGPLAPGGILRAKTTSGVAGATGSALCEGRGPRPRDTKTGSSATGATGFAAFWVTERAGRGLAAKAGITGSCARSSPGGKLGAGTSGAGTSGAGTSGAAFSFKAMVVSVAIARAAAARSASGAGPTCTGIAAIDGGDVSSARRNSRGTPSDASSPSAGGAATALFARGSADRDA